MVPVVITYIKPDLPYSVNTEHGNGAINYRNKIPIIFRTSALIDYSVIGGGCIIHLHPEFNRENIII